MLELKNVKYEINQILGPLINSYLKNRHKNYLKQKACKTGNLNDWERYKHTRNNYNKLMKDTIKIYYSNDIQISKENLKKTWKSNNQCLTGNP